MTTRLRRSTLDAPIRDREPKYKDIDISALRAVAQAAINVELFTIPLYMTSLYSIQGMHQINSQGLDYYKGRLWPGPATTAAPSSANEKAYNIIYSVFIEEMLHLQLASNLAVATGLKPTFTSNLLQDNQHGWTCYGDNLTVLPHIVDLRDTIKYENVKVKLDALNSSQVLLFLAIEEPAKTAEENIKPGKEHLYFPKVPFAGWTTQKTEKDLPMFGSIGWMYRCYADYLDIEYSDGTKLWDIVYNSASLQRDQFNVASPGHPYREYTILDTTLMGWLPGDGMKKAIDMIDAITDQGEGSLIPPSDRASSNFVNDVLPRYRPALDALKADYPAFTDSGKPAPSRDAAARYDNSKPDHYERFQEIQKDLQTGKILTWDQWHASGKKWTAQDLKTKDYDPAKASKNIPTPEDVAGALNRIKPQANMFKVFSKICVGSIAGITTVLDQYWSNPTTGFPNPSMYGSGDRLAICWAIFGKAPDLSIGIGSIDHSKLYHACQGLDFDKAGQNCAAVEIFHTCRGSNSCRAQGGCGFVQPVTGGGSCSTSFSGIGPGGVCGAPSVYNAPSDNKCTAFGGCAVPISASQLFPKAGVMQLFNFEGTPPKSVEIPVKIPFKVSDSVYDIAWEAYLKVMAVRKKDPGTKPPPNDLRIALPPST